MFLKSIGNPLARAATPVTPKSFAVFFLRIPVVSTLSINEAFSRSISFKLEKSFSCETKKSISIFLSLSSNSFETPPILFIPLRYLLFVNKLLTDKIFSFIIAA